MNQAPATTTETEKTGQIDCLLMPLRERQLLLPNVTVAEIIPFSHLLTTNSAVDWILGRISWRGISIPVICYEILNNTPSPSPNPAARFAVINGVGKHSQMPFYAMLVQGIPKLKKVNENEIQQIDAMGKGTLDVMSVALDGEESAFIPDMAKIEQSLLKYV
jgi:chemosensory pili system protein ChpC